MLLGDTTITNMNAIPLTVFTNSDAYLRVWFSDGVSGFQQLLPDQRVAAVGYALMAESVPDGTITSSKLADGTVTSAKLAPGAVQAAALDTGAVGAAQILDGSIVDADISPSADIDASKIAHGDLLATRLKVGSGHTLSSGGLHATIAGGEQNSVSAAYAAIGGGKANSISSSHGFIGGGLRNSVSSSYATVGGGNNNAASALEATVGGGYFNEATGVYAAVGGGTLNSAGAYATVPGGSENVAAGDYSFAAGRRAIAGHKGSFVWGDGTDAGISSTSTNQFIVRASGGVWLGTNSSPVLTNGYFLNTSTGGYLSSGGVWTDNCDRNAKENFTPIDPVEILHRVANLPITSWNYRTEGKDVKHVGPVAQDFYAAFTTGQDERHLAALDSAGVALAAIQGLNAEVSAKDARISELEQSLEELKQQVRELTILMKEPREPMNPTEGTGETQ